MISNEKMRGHMSWILSAFLGMFVIPTWVQAADTNTLYFAQMADGGGYVTSIVLVNPGTADLNATLETLKSDGSPLTVTLNGATGTSFTQTIKARGSLFLMTSGKGEQTSTGWVRVRGTEPLGGSLVYSYFSGGKAISEAGLDPSLPVTQFCFTVDTRQGNFSGLAVVNPNSTPLEIRYVLYDVEGNLKAEASQQLGSMQHAAKLIGEIFPTANLNDFTGTVTAISSGGMILATTLRFDSEVSRFASIPVVIGLQLAPVPTTTSTSSSTSTTSTSTSTTTLLHTTTTSAATTSTTIFGPSDGHWTGTTSRNEAMSFDVSSGGSKWSNFKVQTPFSTGWCSGSFSITISQSSPNDIVSGAFQGGSGTTFSFTGQLTSDTTASGTYTFNKYLLSSSCGTFSDTGTWTASLHP